MIATGVIHGRFQVLHNDHLRYLEAGRARCRHLVIGITNPDPVHTAPESADPERGRPEANPLTYYERYRMLRAALDEAGWAPEAYSIVPLPINFPELYGHYVPPEATFLLTIYDAWGRRKRARFEALGLRVEVLWERPPGEKGICGHEVRRRMRAGEEWASLVPPSVHALMERWRIPERLRAHETPATE